MIFESRELPIFTLYDCDYPVCCDLIVLEKIQDKVGDILVAEDKIRGYVPSVDADGVVDKLTAGTGIDIVDNTVSAKSATADEAGIVKIGSDVNTADDETALSTARFKSVKTSLETATKAAMKVYYGTSTNSSNIATVSLNMYSTLVADFSYPSPIGKILCVKFANASKARTTSSLKVQNISYTIVGGESVGMWSAGDIAVFVVISSTQVIFIGSQTTAMSGNPFGTTKVHIPYQSNVEITDTLKVNCVNSSNELIANYAFTKMTVHQFVFEGKSGAFADVSFIITGYNSTYSQGNFAVRAWCKIPSDKTATTVQLYPYAIQPVKSTIVSQALMYYITSDTIAGVIISLKCTYTDDSSPLASIQ